MMGVSFAAILIKAIAKEGVPSLTIAFYRMLFTTLIIAPFALGHAPCRHEFKELSRKNLLLMGTIGIILAAHFYFWISSLETIQVASSVTLVTAHPVLVAPLAYFLFRERLSAINIIGICICLSGTMVLILGNYSLTSSTLVGNLLAVLGGIAAGLYILGGRHLRKTLSTPTYVFIVFGTATLMLGVVCVIFGSPLSKITIKSYELLLLMAMISGIGGHTLYNWALKYVRASVVSVSLLFEPIGASLLAFALPWLHEVPTPYTILGGCLIIYGIYLTMLEYKSRDTQ